MSSPNFGAKFYSKLQDLSKSEGIDMLALVRIYAQQRLLYRLSVSDCGADFCLKGGLMLAAYNGGDIIRPTDDIDLNGFGFGGIDEIERAIRMAIAVEVPEDGVEFNASNLKIQKDRGEGLIPGGKVVIEGRVHTARVQIKVDVGFGNVITPMAQPIEIPTLLAGLVPCPVISAYPLETIVAEKLHAVAQFGLDNTRLKDYYDIWRVQRTYEFQGKLLSEAVAATFEQQNRKLKTDFVGLSDLFGMKAERDWRAFLKKTIVREDISLKEVVGELRDFLVPVIEGAISGDCDLSWLPEVGWNHPAPGMRSSI